ALGLNDQYYFWVVVDGRRPGISDGMTYRELAQEMVSWNCQEAMSIDGGASAMLWIEGEIKNIPSEDRERPNANSLFVLRKPEPPTTAKKKR
ncbi:MAG: phosphodiester glycosidase family protein, partial [Limisphaerales bacterium]